MAKNDYNYIYCNNLEDVRNIYITSENITLNKKLRTYFIDKLKLYIKENMFNLTETITFNMNNVDLLFYTSGRHPDALKYKADRKEYYFFHNKNNKKQYFGIENQKLFILILKRIIYLYQRLIVHYHYISLYHKI
jgi:hypothetical protein